jgi:transcriptional regulator with XRE-family HTH domain
MAPSSPAGLSAELREFLRARRRALVPESLGLPARRRWRTPGLRIQDVAELAGVSPSWYGNFELGGASNVGARTLLAIAGALRLDTPETEYLFRLTSTPRPPEPAHPASAVVPALRRLVETYRDGIAMLLDFRYDIVTANTAAYRLGFAGDGPAFENNLFWRSFLTPECLRLAGTWRNVQGPPFVAILRRLYAESAGDARLDALIQALRSGSPTFTALWETRQVAASNSRQLHFTLPSDETIVVDTLILAEDGGLRICYFIPADDASLARLRPYAK